MDEQENLTASCMQVERIISHISEAALYGFFQLLCLSKCVFPGNIPGQDKSTRRCSSVSYYMEC